jgi:hypothetical protein
MRNLVKNAYLALLASTSVSSIATAMDANPTVQMSYDDAGCSDSLASSYDDYCHSKLHRGAVRFCLNKGYSGEVDEIFDSYDFDGGNGDACSTTSGRYISYACLANYRCR